ncbi:medium-chain acyl-CoA ligase ACSF2, mitochondrial-like [Dreissena polymorpha]|uniref:AMP-dependent synthetase/ligase domain-containing protein n=1 Tax=Dreissena polymorpha TaxID=45954 RepID=A0A9D4S3R2_DREPO|nr:medium-chain acyl-CoA ligase ACSF2, mitochondrial-like [Dreissena polymorpha]KAH3891464.1 hypothetical protein DPMN_015566 [Dreissena polymorpha]
MAKAERKTLCDFTRDCTPSGRPLVKSYFHGVCATPLSADTVGDVIRMRARDQPDRVVFRVPHVGQELTLGELNVKASRVSRALLGVGLRKGDIVFHAGLEDQEYIIWYFATLQIGLVFLYTLIETPPEKDTNILCNLGPKLVCVGDKVLPGTVSVLKERNKKHPEFKLVSLHSGMTDPDFSTYDDFLREGKSVTEQVLLETVNSVSIDDDAVLFVSSGTTSTEHKVSCTTHQFLVNTAMFAHQRIHPYTEPDVIGLTSPVIDDSVCISLVGLVLNGDVGVLAPPEMTFKPDYVEVFMQFIQDNGITWYSGTPFEFVNAVQSTERHKYDLSSLRGGNLVGQTLTEPIKQKLLREFPDMLTLYGATECLIGLGCSVRWSTPTQRVLSLGFPYAHCEVKLVNERDEVVPVGSQGEVCIRGWPVLKRYQGNESLTLKAKHHQLNGWYHYGDIGIMDETGHVRFIGRKAECVRFKHFSDTIYPSVIFDAVKKDSRVLNAKVVGIHNDQIGDDICLCVEVGENSDVTEDQLRQLLENEVHENSRPDFYFIFEKFPRTGPRQKIAYQDLRETVAEKLQQIKLQTGQ